MGCQRFGSALDPSSDLEHWKPPRSTGMMRESSSVRLTSSFGRGPSTRVRKACFEAFPLALAFGREHLAPFEERLAEFLETTPIELQREGLS